MQPTEREVVNQNPRTRSIGRGTVRLRKLEVEDPKFATHLIARIRPGFAALIQ
jgi:hypothetical protein